LTIDGVPAPIYQVNRMMRGAAVDKDRHHLVYTYAPKSFRFGKIVSAIGVATFLLLSAVCFLRPVDPIVGSSDPTSTEDSPHV
jgi:uncharacterized membrane protein YfhO